MKIKHFQHIANIQNHLDDAILLFEKGDESSLGLLNHWCIRENELPEILEEQESLRYLLGCNNSVVRGIDAKKLDLEVFVRCFNRHLLYLDNVHNCNVSNALFHKSFLIRGQYKTSKFYLFKLSSFVWFSKLPEIIKGLNLTDED